MEGVKEFREGKERKKEGTKVRGGGRERRKRDILKGMIRKIQFVSDKHMCPPGTVGCFYNSTC